MSADIQATYADAGNNLGSSCSGTRFVEGADGGDCGNSEVAATTDLNATGAVALLPAEYNQIVGSNGDLPRPQSSRALVVHKFLHHYAALNRSATAMAAGMASTTSMRLRSS